MNQGPNRIFDDIAKLMTDAAGAAQGVRREAETAFRSQAERFLGGMDLVKRDEFEAFKEMASNLKMQNDALKAQVEELVARVESLEGKKPASSKAASSKDSKTPAKSTVKSSAKAAGRTTAEKKS